MSDAACPSSTDSICSVALWPHCSPSETSMLTGWTSPGQVCIALASENGNARGAFGTGWHCTKDAELGVRNLAHSCPLVISSSRLNEPRPNSKSLPQEKRGRIILITQIRKLDPGFIKFYKSLAETFKSIYSKEKNVYV